MGSVRLIQCFFKKDFLASSSHSDLVGFTQVLARSAYVQTLLASLADNGIALGHKLRAVLASINVLEERRFTALVDFYAA